MLLSLLLAIQRPDIQVLGISKSVKDISPNEEWRKHTWTLLGGPYTGPDLWEAATIQYNDAKDVRFVAIMAKPNQETDFEVFAYADRVTPHQPEHPYTNEFGSEPTHYQAGPSNTPIFRRPFRVGSVKQGKLHVGIASGSWELAYEGDVSIKQDILTKNIETVDVAKGKWGTLELTTMVGIRISRMLKVPTQFPPLNSFYVEVNPVDKPARPGPDAMLGLKLFLTHDPSVRVRVWKRPFVYREMDAKFEPG